ncbi:two-partner secretion domain-containing protein [Acinetobacter kookii]
MNKIYRVIWNKQLACWQAVSELAKSHSSTTQKAAASETESSVCHSLSSVSTWMRSILFFSVAMLPFSIHAAISSTELPTGAQINSGSASFNQTGNTLNINQNSQNLSTHWNTFNIGQDATVNFNQPNQSSTAINHVLDSNASQIMGRLNANGQVFLLNPNGVVFSKTAQVNVGGLVASTLNLSDADIQNGKYTLKGDANSTASIENQGSTQTLQGGTVALIAPNVKNTGTISTPNGTTHLTSASQVTLALQDGSLTQYQVDQGVLQGLVDNGGAIIADNGAVYLTAKAKDSLSKAVVNHSGIIEANRLSQNAKGEIILLGDMQSGETHVSGTLKAEGKNGQDGGFIETSAAKVNIDKDIKIFTLSDGGKTGNWLIDPYNVVISNTADSGTGFTATQDDTVINATTLTTALATTGITVSTGGTGVGTQDGNITVDADLTWASNSTLTLQADKDIQLNKKITAQNGGLTLNAANNISASDAINVGTFTLTKGNWLQNIATLPGFYAKDFRLNGGSFIRAIGGDGSAVNPWQLTDIYGVQGMGTKLNGNFALASDIDASGTINWNGGAGFKPVGSDSTYFTGTLDGLGHTISKLTINLPSTNYVGLFGKTFGTTIQNVGLLDASIKGSDYVGGLVGYDEDGTISNAYVIGTVTGVGQMYVGGLAGVELGGTISNAYVTGTVTGRHFTGSLAGGGG